MNPTSKYICSFCYKLLTTKQGLQNHIKQIHQKIKPFLCKQGEDSLAYFLTNSNDMTLTITYAQLP